MKQKPKPHIYTQLIFPNQIQQRKEVVYKQYNIHNTVKKVYIIFKFFHLKNSCKKILLDCERTRKDGMTAVDINQEISTPKNQQEWLLVPVPKVIVLVKELPSTNSTREYNGK